MVGTKEFEPALSTPCRYRLKTRRQPNLELDCLESHNCLYALSRSLPAN